MLSKIDVKWWFFCFCFCFVLFLFVWVFFFFFQFFFFKPKCCQKLKGRSVRWGWGGGWSIFWWMGDPQPKNPVPWVDTYIIIIQREGTQELTTWHIQVSKILLSLMLFLQNASGKVRWASLCTSLSKGHQEWGYDTEPYYLHSTTTQWSAQTQKHCEHNKVRT